MQEKWWVAVIVPGSHGEPEDRKDIFALPKGNLDSNEKPEQAALREVMEETGLRAKTVTKLVDIKYIYRRKWAGGEKIFKVVSFFLMKYQSGKIGEITEAMKREVRHAFWLPLEEAPAKLSYSGEKKTALQALKYIQSHPEEFQIADTPH
jgi:8-oxo-dGTP pyrophosphatase MutT (NUDIX family)